MTKEKFSLTIQDSVHCICEMVNLDSSHFEEVYAIDMQAFEELNGKYIKKSEEFIKACLHSECSVGIKTEDTLIATVTVNIEKINDEKRASILGFKEHWPVFIGFIEGAYVLPKFRKKGLITRLYCKAVHLLKEKGIQHIYSAIDPRNHANIIAMTKSDFTLQNLYHSNLNGDLRYLIKHHSEQEFLTDKQHTVLIDDHDTQVAYFKKGYVGVHITVKNVASEKTSDNKPATSMVLMKKR